MKTTLNNLLDNWTNQDMTNSWLQGWGLSTYEDGSCRITKIYEDELNE